MTDIRCILLLSTCLIAAGNLEASESNFNSNHKGSSFSLQIKHTPLELEPINFLKGVKTASVRSLVNINKDFTINGNGNDYDYDETAQCRSEGYLYTSCPNTQVPVLGSRCPSDDRYFSACECPSRYKYNQSRCNSTFTNSVLGFDTCNPAEPITGGFGNSGNEASLLATACICDTSLYPYSSNNCSGNKVPSGNKCIDSEGNSYAEQCTCAPQYGQCGSNQYHSGNDYCEENGETLYPQSACKTCEGNSVPNDAQNACQCPDNFIECSAENNEIGIGEACILDAGKFSECQCPSDWKNCDNYGPEVSAKSCTLNGRTVYSSCKDDPCRIYDDYTKTNGTCPAGYTCSECKNSSGTNQYITGCAINYTNIENCTWWSCWTNTAAKN